MKVKSSAEIVIIEIQHWVDVPPRGTVLKMGVKVTGPEQLLMSTSTELELADNSTAPSNSRAKQHRT